MKLDLEQLATGLAGIAIYRNATKDSVLAKFEGFLAACVDNKSKRNVIELYSKFVEALYQKGGDFGKYLSELLEDDDNIYARLKAAGKEIPSCMEETIKKELKFFSSLTHITSIELFSAADLPSTLARFDNSRFDFTETIPERLLSASKCGYGIYAKYGMFRIDNAGKIVPVFSPDTVEISSLVGYEQERSEVINNTRALVEGKPAANVLLCGDAGTGKSSTVKAVANMFKSQGVRLIEMRKDQLLLLPEIMSEISENPLKFIIFVDDLSFATDDDSFGTLKAALEGSASTKAANTVIYATSNRRHLVKETFSSRQGDEVHRRDAMEELMSLSERFGLTVLFSKPTKALYLEIVLNLVKTTEINIDTKELELKAEAFALAKGGRSARVALQFVNSLITQG